MAAHNGSPYVIIEAPSDDTALIGKFDSPDVGVARKGQEPLWLDDAQTDRFITCLGDTGMVVLSSDVSGWDDDEEADAKPSTFPSSLQSAPASLTSIPARAFKYRVLQAPTRTSYIAASRDAEGSTSLHLMEKGKQVSQVQVPGHNFAWLPFREQDGGVAFPRNEVGVGYKITWDGHHWTANRFDLPILARQIYSSSASHRFVVLSDMSAFVLIDGHVTPIPSGLHYVSEWYPTRTGYVLAGRKSSSRTGVQLQIEFHATNDSPLWTDEFAGERYVMTTSLSSEFYVVGAESAEHFDDKGHVGTSPPGGNSVGYSRAGHLMKIDKAGMIAG